MLHACELPNLRQPCVDLLLAPHFGGKLCLLDGPLDGALLLVQIVELRLKLLRRDVAIVELVGEIGFRVGDLFQAGIGVFGRFGYEKTVRERLEWWARQRRGGGEGA